MKKTHILKHRGFSLIEIVLALGLSSVGLLSLLGVLGISMNASRDAGDDAALAAMFNQVLTELSAVPFDALAHEDIQYISHKDSFNSPPEEPLPDTIYYFNEQGWRVAGSATDSENAPVFECRVRKIPDQTFSGVSGGKPNLLLLELTFSWPVSHLTVPNRRPSQYRFCASLARYQ